MNEEKEVNVLDELNKGCCMGMDAINYIKEKNDLKDFNNILDTQYKIYEDISNRIEEIYSKYSEKDPHETSTMNKVMTWYGIQMKTVTDSTTSKLAELVLQGLNMGIIEGRRLLNHKDCDKDTNNLIDKYVNSQEKTVEELKEFL